MLNYEVLLTCLGSILTWILIRYNILVKHISCYIISRDGQCIGSHINLSYFLDLCQSTKHSCSNVKN